MNILGKSTALKKKVKKRLGRGISAGGGKTAGRGTKGQKSRAGHNIPRQFEGGQSNLSLRLPKMRGFKNTKRPVVEISLGTLDKNFKSGQTVDMDALITAGLLKPGEKAKILANGELTKKLKINEVPISKAALAIVEKVKESHKPAEPKAEPQAESPKKSKNTEEKETKQ